MSTPREQASTRLDDVALKSPPDVFAVQHVLISEECRQLLQKGAFSKRWPSFDFRQAKSNSEPQLRFSASGNLMFTLPQSTASKTWGLSEQFCAC